MKQALTRFLIGLILPIPLHAQFSAAQLDSLQQEYIRKFKDIAMDEMERSGVPASIKLAQAILESRAGTSELAMNANNHFGIKCGKNWSGLVYRKHDDERNKKGEPVKSSFRQYHSVVECYADHSEFFRSPEKKHRYDFLFDLDPRDYIGWAKGLQQAGYSPVDYYADRLIFFIQRHQLYEYDWLALNGRMDLKRLATVNGAKMVQARSGETLRDIAALYNLPVEKLVAYNDSGYQVDEPLGLGAWVYVQSKRDSWQGPGMFHPVEEGQRLFDIAQLYGVQMEKLRQMNGLRANSEPAPAEQIRLRGKRRPGEQVRPMDTPETAIATADPAPAETDPDPAPDAPDISIEMLPQEPLPEPVPWADLETTWPPQPQEAAMETGDPADPTPTRVSGNASGKSAHYYTVEPGDTLYGIARRYGVTTAQIRKLNRKNDNIVKIGQTLRIY